nr:guanine nucleotide binding protein subunit [Hymenolepis microstoma]
MQTETPHVLKKRFIFQRCIRENLAKMIRCRKSGLRNFLIDQELLEDQELHRREIRLLLLGNRGSGRSTMVKQLRIHYGDSFPTSVRKFLIPFVMANLADTVVRVVKMMQVSYAEISDPYINELAVQLVRSQPPEGYTVAVSFAYYSKSLSVDAHPRNSFIDLTGLQSISEEESIPLNHSRLSALSNTSVQTSQQGGTSPTHTPGTPLHIKLSKSLGVKEIQLLLGSLHPEVNWEDVIRTEVFNKAPEGVDESEALTKWLEVAFKAGKLHPAKVMAALQERVCNPYIRKLPVEIAAQLPPPNEAPPPPPSTSVPNLDSNIFTDTDDWSSDTSFQSEAYSLCDEEISTHSNALSEENHDLEEREVKIQPSFTVSQVDDKESLVTHSQMFNFASINGRMLKLIIDQPEFQAFLTREEAKSQLEMSTSQLYFINNVDRFIQSDYAPTLRDILLVQMPCNAVRESLLQVGSTSLRLINIGDQRGDRRKWVYLFETIHAVLFFASLVDFVEKSQFSEFETKLDESLEYFWFVLESLPLSRKDSILFLTKKDILLNLLTRKMWSVPSNYPELQETDDPETSISIQRDLFLSKSEDRGHKTGRVFTHTVCLLDIDEMKSKSKAVLKDVLESNFRRHAVF